MAKDIKAQLEQVQAALKEMTSFMAPLIEANNKSIADTGKGLDSFVETMADHAARFADLKSAINTLSAEGSAAGKGGSKKGDRRSLGRKFTDDEGFKEWKKKTGRNGVTVEVGKVWSKSRASHYATKGSDVIDIDDVDASGIIAPQFIRPAIPIAQPTAVMRSLCTVIQTEATDTVNIGRETEFNKLITKITADTGAGNTVFPVENANGFLASAPFSAITLDNGTSTEAVTIASIDLAASTITLSAVSTIALTTANGTLKGSKYAPTPAGLIAPRSNKKFEDLVVKICDLPSGMVVTLNQLRDVPSLEETIRQNLLAGLGEMEDVNMFYGTGDFEGAFNNTALQASQLVLSAQPVGTKELDLLSTAFYAIAADNYRATVALVSVDVHRRLVESKASDGNYIFFNNVPEGGGPVQVFLMQLMMTNTLSAQDGIVADFETAFYILDREQADIEIGTEDRQLSQRERTILINERIGFGIPKPEAARLLTFDALPV